MIRKGFEHELSSGYKSVSVEDELLRFAGCVWFIIWLLLSLISGNKVECFGMQ